jgi:uncharacterized LabA/DUF88 family protein
MTVNPLSQKCQYTINCFSDVTAIADNTAPAIPSKKRCVVYVDGFNWYFSIFRRRPEWKWLNLQSFFEALRLDEEIVAVKFFTAWVEPRRKISPTRDRQTRYINALKSLPKVQTIFGKYQERRVTCRATCREEYQVPEEKKTDVNIAVNVIDDVLKGRAETVIVVSGDSDLEPAVAWVRTNHPKVKVTVYIPTLPEEEAMRRNDYYPTIGVNCKPLPLADIAKHLLPNSVVFPDGKIVEKPKEWP